jgi:hypothetical protein
MEKASFAVTRRGHHPSGGKVRRMVSWEAKMKNGTKKKTPKKTYSDEFAAAVGRALRRAARVARKTAKMYGTPIYIVRDGKIVAEKP